MTNDKVRKAKAEAKRFLEKVADLEKSTISDPWFSGSKETGAVRRASMDLTRVLAELRKV